MHRLVTPITFALALVAGVGIARFSGDEPGSGLSAVMLVVSLVLLVLGADAMVHGAVRLARRFGVSPFFVGVTVVAFGTSAPELAASVGATLKNAGELAIGNVLGSNIANICLILGITAIIKPVPVDRSVWRVDAPIMMGVTIIASFALLDRLFFDGAVIGRIDGVLLVLGLFAYVWYNARTGRIDPEKIEQEVEIELDIPLVATAALPAGSARTWSYITPIVLVVVGLAGLILGAQLLVDGATSIALAIGVSDAIIGLTIVAFGTSLPELVFSARAAMKNHPEIAIGNIIGSNVFNLLSVLGVAALVRPIAIPAEAVHRDIWWVWTVTAVCCFMMWTQTRVSRAEGVFLLLTYAGYTLYLYLG